LAEVKTACNYLHITPSWHSLQYRRPTANLHIYWPWMRLAAEPASGPTL